MTLNQLKSGAGGKIIFVGGQGALRRRLMDMGLTIGAQITVVRTAPLGDPIEYSLRGYDLSLRKLEADLIEVDVEG